MEPYIILLILIIFGIIQCDFQRNSDFKGLYLLIYLYASGLAGAFVSIGGDCYDYASDFDTIPYLEQLSFSDLTIGYRQQPFWIYFNSICKGIFDNFNFYLLIHSLIINGVFFYFISKHTKYKFTALLLFVTTMNYFYFDIEIQREALAVAVALIFYKYLQSKQYLYYYIGCVIAFLFHVSAVILLLLPIIFYLFKYKRKGWYIYIASLLVIGICSISSYISYFSDFEYTSGMVSQFENYNELKRNSTNLIISSAFSSVPIIIFLYISRKINYNNDTLANFAYLYLILTLCGPFVTGITRMNNYLYFPYLAFIADVLMTKKQNSNWKTLCAVAVICMYISVLYLWSRPLMQFDFHIRYYELFVPYRSCFEIL